MCVCKKKKWQSRKNQEVVSTDKGLRAKPLGFQAVWTITGGCKGWGEGLYVTVWENGTYRAPPGRRPHAWKGIVNLQFSQIKKINFIVAAPGTRHQLEEMGMHVQQYTKPATILHEQMNTLSVPQILDNTSSMNYPYSTIMRKEWLIKMILWSTKEPGLNFCSVLFILFSCGLITGSLIILILFACDSHQPFGKRGDRTECSEGALNQLLNGDCASPTGTDWDLWFTSSHSQALYNH